MQVWQLFNLTTVYHQWHSAILEIYDLFGRRMFSEEVLQSEKEVAVDVSLWSSGMYVVRLVYNNQTAGSVKIIIEPWKIYSLHSSFRCFRWSLCPRNIIRLLNWTSIGISRTGIAITPAQFFHIDMYFFKPIQRLMVTHINCANHTHYKDYQDQV